MHCLSAAACPAAQVNLPLAGVSREMTSLLEDIIQHECTYCQLCP